MKAYHSTSVTVEPDQRITAGRAVVHDDGTVSGHVTIYTTGGSLTIASDDPVALDGLADALHNAAEELGAAQEADLEFTATVGDAV